MVFSSLEFLFFFLPAVLLLYFAVPSRFKNLVLLLASLGFYVSGGGALVVLLIVSTVADFVAGRVVHLGVQTERPRLARYGVLLSVAVNLGMLGYYKYANFFVDQLNSIGTTLGAGTIAWNSIALPIGISFYTFQSMSYTLDVYRGRVEPLRNIVDFGLYVSLFPQLIAGPIVRFHEISQQIRERNTTLDDFAGGVVRFGHGLVKKVVVADAVAPIVDASFSASSPSAAAAWIGVLAYTVQIYFDFSGYSDMAIGLGRMLGFRFPENFLRPYSALSITDFWRRWHVTLSAWFRDYLYVPLGGNRGTAARTYGNLIVVLLLTGLWHGANWTFIVWGIYHGALLIIERVTGQRAVSDQSSFKAMRRMVTFFLVVVGWVVFRANDIGHAWSYLGAMFGAVPGTFPAELAVALNDRATLTLIVALTLTVLLPRGFVLGPRLAESVGWRPALGRFALVAVLLPYALTLVASGSFSPFLYYQF